MSQKSNTHILSPLFIMKRKPWKSHCFMLDSEHACFFTCKLMWVALTQSILNAFISFLFVHHHHAMVIISACAIFHAVAFSCDWMRTDSRQAQETALALSMLNLFFWRLMQSCDNYCVFTWHCVCFAWCVCIWCACMWVRIPTAFLTKKIRMAMVYLMNNKKNNARGFLKTVISLFDQKINDRKCATFEEQFFEQTRTGFLCKF